MTRYAWIVKQDRWRPIVQAEPIKRGRMKGLYRVTFGDGRRGYATVIREKEATPHDTSQP